METSDLLLVDGRGLESSEGRAGELALAPLGWYR
jgi:hypothetical protein